MNKLLLILSLGLFVVACESTQSFDECMEATHRSSYVAEFNHCQMQMQMQNWRLPQ